MLVIENVTTARAFVAFAALPKPILVTTIQFSRRLRYLRTKCTQEPFIACVYCVRWKNQAQTAMMIDGDTHRHPLH